MYRFIVRARFTSRVCVRFRQVIPTDALRVSETPLEPRIGFIEYTPQLCVFVICAESLGASSGRACTSPLLAAKCSQECGTHSMPAELRATDRREEAARQ